LREPGPTQQAVRDVVWPLAESLAREMGLVLVDVAFGMRGRRATLSIVLDRPGGITLGEVEAFHRCIDPLLDAADPIPTSYVLEVSSPGAERRLRTERDYHIFVGRWVRILTTEPVAGRQQWDGRLAGVQDGSVRLRTSDGEVAVPLTAIRIARLVWEDQDLGTR